MTVLCGMPTIQYSAPSARLMVAHSGHLNLEIQTAFWDRNGFLRQKRHFVEPDRKIQSLTAFRKWNYKFPKPNALPQPKRKFRKRKQHFRKQNGIRKLERHSSPDRNKDWIKIVKIINFKRYSEIETENMFVEESWILGIFSCRCVSPNRCHVQFSDPDSRHFIEWPMGVDWWRHQATPI